MYKRLYLAACVGLTLITGCIKKYPKQNLKHLTEETADRVQTQSDVTVLTKVWDEQETYQFFAGYCSPRVQPIQITIDNQSANSYILAEENILLLQAPLYVAGNASSYIAANSIALSAATATMAFGSYVLCYAAISIGFDRVFALSLGLPIFLMSAPFVGFLGYTTHVAVKNKETALHALAQVFDKELNIPAYTTVDTLLLVDKKQFEQESCSIALNSYEKVLDFDLL